MFSNFIRCTGLTAVLVIVAAIGLPGASSAQIVDESPRFHLRVLPGQPSQIVIDGNANDLISATENPAPGTCGDSQDDSGDTATNAQNGEGTATPCTNYPGGDPGSAGDDYVNGFVLNLGAFFYDPAAEELYVAWRSAGVIGDVDADGDPTTFCAEAVGSGINEQPGISTNDEYRLEIDVDCTLGFGADITLRVSGDGAGNPILQLVSGVFPFSGYDVDYNGSDLELRIDGVSLTNFPNFGFAMRLKSGTFDDTLAEDTVPPMTCEPPDPSVEITKECDDVCAGDATECTITVTNNGLVPLENIVVFDDIPAGHAFVQVVSGAVTPSPAGGNDYEFTLNNPLDPGADHTFTIEIQTPVDCFGEVTNNVDVEGEFTSECYDSEPTTRLAFDETSATYSCTPGVCLENLTAAGPGEVCSGGLFDICGTVDNCGVEAVEVVVKLNGGSDQVIVIPAQSTSEEFCFEGLSVSCDTDGAETVYTVTVENSATDDCGDDLETFDVTVTCRKPEICLTKDDDITGEGCVANDGDVTYTLVVENCGPTDLTDVVVADTVSCEFATYVPDSATEGGVFAAGIITWNIGDLAEGDSRTLEYTVHIFVDGCTGQEACDNTAYAEGYCVEDQATDVATHTVCIECPGENCPRTIGFWRQQCDQKGNGSTKICVEVMEELWTCVLEESGVNYWRDVDGSVIETSELDTFDDPCRLLDGPRPMTVINMAQLQFLGSWLNICGGALNPSAPYDDGQTATTVGEALADLAELINAYNDGDPTNDPSVEDLNHFKDISDNINNGLYINTGGCEDDPLDLRGDERCPNLDGDLGGEGEGQFGYNQVHLRAHPNPTRGNSGTVITYSVPDRLSQSRMEISVYSVTGRLVRQLVDGTASAGEFTAFWDLRDASGSAVSNGIYFYRIRVGSETQTQRLLVIHQ